MKHRSIAITGASRGLGAALALLHADAETHLFLCARSQSDLETIANKCREQGAAVETDIVDINNENNVESWANKVFQKGALDIFYLNAGIFGGVRETEQFELRHEAVEIINTNLIGCISAVSSFIPHMEKAGQGRLVFISSLAARYPLADAPAYSASKAGVLGYAIALRELLEPLGIAVTCVLSGHIKTQQSEMQAGGLHFLLSPEEAARKIIRGVTCGQKTIAFPWGLNILTRLSTLVADGLRYRLNKPFRFRIK